MKTNNFRDNRNADNGSLDAPSRLVGLHPRGREVRALLILVLVFATIGMVAVTAWGSLVSVATQVSRTGGWNADSELPTLFRADEAPRAELDGATYVVGKQLFGATCAACHGLTGLGVPNLGKNLVMSRGVKKQSNLQLVEFIKRGRGVEDPLNTTKVPMPPRGGNAAFTDEHIGQISVYLRGLQDPRRIPAVLPAPKALVLPAALPTGPMASLPGIEESDYDAESIRTGQKLFLASCVSCHGADARGIVKLGRDLVKSPFIFATDDEKMLAFLKSGRSSSDPANTTKVDMPPKGGNPALNEEGLGSIIAYLRYLQECDRKSP